MKFVEPRIYHLGGTTTDYDSIERFLMDQYELPVNKSVFGGTMGTIRCSEGEQLVEFAGRLCYRSFAPELNANVTKVREDVKGYFENILKSRHGSVLEHSSDTYLFANVSRVFTHEIVRHRLCNFSQESLRFVRLTNLNAWFPDSFADIDAEGCTVDGENTLKEIFEEAFENLEGVQRILAQGLDLDNLGFNEKKRLTSAMRRMAPIGLATAIVVTTNHRNWRHLIGMRTSVHAEEEIRLVMAQVAQDLQVRHPLIYQDMYVNQKVNGVPEYTFKYGRV